MRYTAVTFLTIASAALAAPSWSTESSRGCGSILGEAEMQAAEQTFQLAIAANPVAVDTFTVIPPIAVYWHVVHSSSSLTGGYLSDAAITGSIDAMNDHFNGTGFSFYLAGADRTQSATWFSNVSPGSTGNNAMKNALYTGGVKALNVYSVGFESGGGAGLLGYATFPSDYNSAPELDGVVILYSSVPGGSTQGYNEGKTLTHEVGHWLGLYHVFQGGCNAPGDYVDDTPPQVRATGGCPLSQDSCSGGGVDSIHNYMDYSTDPCMWEFSVGQMDRAKAQVLTFRNLTAI